MEREKNIKQIYIEIFPWIQKPGLPDLFFIMFLSMLQYIYIHVEASINPNPLTLD